MTKNPRVLIVDRSAETHEVLQTALARRGMRTYSARRARRGLVLAERVKPDLIVLDLELDQRDPEAICAPFEAQSRENATPLVILGSARRSGGDAALGEFVRKPYDYAPLIRKIEELLVRPEGKTRRAA